jgi:hypothetical protein
MKVLESDIGQTAENLADALFRSLLPDGRVILETLHKEGMIKKIQTNQVIMTPNATSHVKLDELNKILNEMRQGEEAIKKLAEVDANAGLVDPTVARRAKAVAEAVNTTTAALDDAAIASDLLRQAERMEAEAKNLIAESKRLKSEAATISHGAATEGKPRRTRASKVRENVNG